MLGVQDGICSCISLPFFFLSFLWLGFLFFRALNITSSLCLSHLPLSSLCSPRCSSLSLIISFAVISATCFFSFHSDLFRLLDFLLFVSSPLSFFLSHHRCLSPLMPCEVLLRTEILRHISSIKLQTYMLTLHLKCMSEPCLFHGFCSHLYMNAHRNTTTCSLCIRIQPDRLFYPIVPSSTVTQEEKLALSFRIQKLSCWCGCVCMRGLVRLMSTGRERVSEQ